MSRHHRLSDWIEFSARARREGKSLREASTAWRAAHMRLRGSPLSPEGEHHHRRRRHVGGLLRQGVPFERAIRSNPELLDELDSRVQSTNVIVHPRGRHSARNRSERHSGGSRLLVIGGLAVGLWYLLRQQRPGGV